MSEVRYGDEVDLDQERIDFANRHLVEWAGPLAERATFVSKDIADLDDPFDVVITRDTLSTSATSRPSCRTSIACSFRAASCTPGSAPSTTARSATTGASV